MNPTSVVNINREKFDIYIGRGTKWGNPFVIGKDGTRVECISKYRKYLMNNSTLLNSLSEIQGKKIGCSCKPLACHGDILAEFADTASLLT